MERKTIIISATSDLVTDQRVHRTAITFTKQNFRVILVGRKLKGSMSVGSRRYRTVRFRLWFEKGFLFYAMYNIRLFIYLMMHRTDLYYANDLDTLAANFLASLIKRKPLVYDSHEYFTGVPELEENAVAKKFWLRLEEFIFPKLNYIITVNQTIASIYEKKYNKRVHVIRNIPEMPLMVGRSSRDRIRNELKIEQQKKMLILQGAGINIDRGAEEAVEAMKFVEDAVLLIIGGGDVFPVLNVLVRKNNLEKKVILKSKLPYDQLIHYTRAADVGLTLDKLSNLNYRYSLPNKLFDYIHARIPVLASPVDEVKKIMMKYQIGMLIDDHKPEHIAERINSMIADENRLNEWKKNLELAATELNWSAEEKKLLTLLHEVI